MKLGIAVFEWLYEALYISSNLHKPQCEAIFFNFSIS